MGETEEWGEGLQSKEWGRKEPLSSYKKQKINSENMWQEKRIGLQNGVG
jgi:hypothetical protein